MKNSIFVNSYNMDFEKNINTINEKFSEFIVLSSPLGYSSSVRHLHAGQVIINHNKYNETQEKAIVSNLIERIKMVEKNKNLPELMKCITADHNSFISIHNYDSYIVLSLQKKSFFIRF